MGFSCILKQRWLCAIFQLLWLIGQPHSSCTVYNTLFKIVHCGVKRSMPVTWYILVDFPWCHLQYYISTRCLVPQGLPCPPYLTTYKPWCQLPPNLTWNNSEKKEYEKNRKKKVWRYTAQSVMRTCMLPRELIWERVAPSHTGVTQNSGWPLLQLLWRRKKLPYQKGIF